MVVLLDSGRYVWKFVVKMGWVPPIVKDSHGIAMPLDPLTGILHHCIVEGIRLEALGVAYVIGSGVHCLNEDRNCG